MEAEGRPAVAVVQVVEPLKEAGGQAMEVVTAVGGEQAPYLLAGTAGIVLLEGFGGSVSLICQNTDTQHHANTASVPIVIIVGAIFLFAAYRCYVKRRRRL